jgi:HD-GYP domain-containing protein (c-di-GMP phosphodiesterase class II)
MGRSSSISPLNFIEALSLALDLASDGLSAHHTRTAVIAYKIGRELGLVAQELQTLTYASLLHDIGAAANWNERKLDVSQGEDIYCHAEKGYQLLKNSRLFGAVAEVIRHHHAPYAGGSPCGIRGEAIPILSRILILAGSVDVLQAQHHRQDMHETIPRISRRVEEAAGSFLDPTVVTAFLKVSRHEGFWLDILTSAYHTQFIRELNFNGKVPFASEDMLHIAGIFASLVDSGSRFTYHHSHNVAAVAGFLAASRGLSEARVRLYKLAGLLHDLGKLAVPNEILEKPGRLDRRECFTVKRHPYFTLRILQRVEGFGSVAEWAGNHHEMPNGCGYPFGIGGKALSMGARIIAVADVYSALNENRPYRSRLDEAEVSAILQEKAKTGELDAGIVADLLRQQAAVQGVLEKQADTWD